MNLNDVLLLVIKILSKILDMIKIIVDKGMIKNLFDLVVNVCLWVFNFYKVVVLLNVCICIYFGDKCIYFELYV